MTGWPAGLIPVCHDNPSGRRSLAAGLRLNLAGPPRRRGGGLVASEDSSSLQACFADGKPGGKEQECAAISQHLLPWMKVAVRAAEQDAHSVHIRFDRARSRMHTERARPGSV